MNKSYLKTNGFIYLLLLIVLPGIAIGSNIINNDTNFDGASDRYNSGDIVLNNAEHRTEFDIKICVIKAGSYLSFSERLDDIGFLNIDILSHSSARNILANYDVVCLPVSWTSTTEGKYDSIDVDNNKYLEYVSDGGGLFIEQPNPYGQPDEKITVNILPVPVTFYKDYIREDSALIVDATHPITQGLPNLGMPFPADTLDSLDDSYHVLVKGKLTDTPSLFVTEYGNGRILVETATHSPGAFHPISDEVMIRMLDWVARDTEASLSKNHQGPNIYLLKQNYPNPFNPSTTIEFAIPKTEFVSVKIYNLLGQEVTTLVARTLKAGFYNYEWNASDLSSGVYYYTITAGEFQDVKKMVLLR